MEPKKIVFQFLLSLLHLIADIFEFLYDKWMFLKIQLNIFVNNHIYKMDFKAESRKLIKVPQHLTVLLCTEEPSIKDLVNFVLWSVAAGIPYISFYDHKGLLKKQIVDFKDEVDKRKGNIHIIWHGEDSIGFKNGFSGSKIHIKLLSPSDGRSKVAESCRNLVQVEKAENINIQCVNVILKRSFEFPDPDLGIYFGNNFNLYNYPPWQIAVTEFLNIRTHHNCHQIEFLQLLWRYSKCEQRLGK